MSISMQAGKFRKPELPRQSYSSYTGHKGDEEMELREKNALTIKSHSDELYYLIQFVQDVNKYIDTGILTRRRVFRNPKPHVRTQGEKLLGQLFNYFDNSIKLKAETGQTSKFTIDTDKYDPEAINIVNRFLENMSKPPKYSIFLYKMAVTHSVSIFESFLQQFMINIFVFQPQKLASTPERTVNFADILSYKSMPKLIEFMAVKRTKKIIDDGIDAIVEEFSKEIKIDLTKFSGIRDLREIFYRRNVIVHNNGKTDSKYCNNISNHKPGEELRTDMAYVEKLFRLMGLTIEYIDKIASVKYKYESIKNVNALLSLKSTKFVF